MPDYKLIKGSTQDQFRLSRNKIQIFGGAYGNGKSAAMCVSKALAVARDYPGSNILMARSTLKKLNKTLRKEFVKWCPEAWIKSFPLPDRDSTTCKLLNGSTIDFTYISQQGKAQGNTTSNVLGGTYDLICIDQIEDPEITYKDFLDLLGRLRGTTVYRPDDNYDPTMPKDGPRWMVLACNPTGNWVYRKIVRPFELYRDKGLITEDLVYDHEQKKCLIDLFQADAYSNVSNTGMDFIKTLEAAYTGQMRDRFVKGKWANYEGLVYPQYSPDIHQVYTGHIKDYIAKMRRMRDGYIVQPHFFEAYDWGKAVPSCYLLGFTDSRGNVFVCDGFYTNPVEEEKNEIDRQAERIRSIRMRWNYTPDGAINFFGDPAIFKRYGPGQTIAEMFADCGIYMSIANNDQSGGITKVGSYLNPQVNHLHPIYGTGGAPYLYIADHLTFFDDEIAQYSWKKNADETNQDVPVDKDDHAMDTLRYLLTKRPELATIIRVPNGGLPAWMVWQEQEIQRNQGRSHRHG